MIHYIDIYHCQCCGALLRQEPDRPVPNCCGRPMAKAAADTVCEDADWKRGPHQPDKGCTCSHAELRRPR